MRKIPIDLPFHTEYAQRVVKQDFKLLCATAVKFGASLPTT